MAVNYLGYDYIQADANLSGTIDIPSGTDYVLCAIQGYGYSSFTSVSIDGDNMSLIDSNHGTSDCFLYGLAAPSTGNGLSVASVSGSWSEGVTYMFSFWSDVDQSNPIRDSVAQDADSGVSSAVLDCIAGEEAWVSGFGNTPPSLTDNSQTLIVDSIAYRSQNGGCSRKAITSGSTTTVGTSGNNYGTMVAAILREASSSGVTATPDDIIAAWSVSSPSASVNCSVSPSAILAGWFLSSPAASLGSIATPEDLFAAWELSAPAVSIEVNAVPENLIASWSVGEATGSVEVHATPEEIIATWGLSSPSAAAGILVEAIPEDLVLDWILSSPAVNVNIAADPEDLEAQWYLSSIHVDYTPGVVEEWELEVRLRREYEMEMEFCGEYEISTPLKNEFEVEVPILVTREG